MNVEVKLNDGTTIYPSFEPGPTTLQQLRQFYVNQYMTLQIQGFAIRDNKGNVLAFNGSI